MCKNTLETSGEDVKLNSSGFTVEEKEVALSEITASLDLASRQVKNTLETSEEDRDNTRNEWGRLRSHSERV
jgi:hypothetical protein